MFSRRDKYDRARILASAARARERGKARDAIQHFTKVLDVEPENVDLHRQLAPLLAQVKRGREAWDSYRRAARVLTKQGYLDKAAEVYRDAIKRVPDQVGAWLSYAALEASRNRKPEAIDLLCRARQHFRGRRRRRDAVRVMEALCLLETRRADYRLELAALCAVTGRRAQGREILAGLALAARGPLLKQVRWLQLRYWPSPRTLVAWARARG